MSADDLDRIKQLAGTSVEGWKERAAKRPPPFEIQILDDEPQIVRNPFSGQTIELDPDELAVYDTIMGANMTGDHDLIHKGSMWFAKHNPEAYMVLID